MDTEGKRVYELSNHLGNVIYIQGTYIIFYFRRYQVNCQDHLVFRNTYIQWLFYSGYKRGDKGMSRIHAEL